MFDGFGFERHMVAKKGGLVAHVQLRLGDGTIMLGSVRKDHLVQWPGPVRETGGNAGIAGVENGMRPLHAGSPLQSQDDYP